MPSAILDGIVTRYEVEGTGPPLLLFSPGGFDATAEKWATLGIYAKTKMFAALRARYRCILFDRRETGRSGGRVERVTWNDYAAQGKRLLEHLGIERAHVMGGCMGCGPVAAFGVAHPEATISMVYYWPVGGARYRITGQHRFAEHLGFVQQHGLAGIVALVTTEGKTFGADPRGGPWAAVIKHDQSFAERFAAQDVEHYKLILTGMARSLFDRDTAPGAEPEELMRLDIPAFIAPGHDASHATSAARYLEECLPRAEYWDAAVTDQTDVTAPPRLLDFLDRAGV